MTASKAKKDPAGHEGRELTETEWAIIKEVWAHEPCAAPTIQEALTDLKGWSYSTVKTLMDRMVDKGLLTTQKIRNLILYRSAITRAQAQKSEIMKTLQRAFNGALTPMMQFLVSQENVSEKELAELEEILKARRTKKK